MRLNRRVSVFARTVALAGALTFSACNSFGPGVFGPQESPSAIARAQQACATVLYNLPQVLLDLRSGEATVAAAFEVSGEQLATYVDTVTDAPKGAPSVWHEKPTKILDLCIIDGDFLAKTPSMPGDDQSAERAAIVIEDGSAKLLLVAFNDQAQIPIVDPATMGT